MKRYALLALPLLTFAAGSAFAHPGHDGGLTAGLAHPYSGLDHLLAMVAVGLWAAQQQGGARWKIPLAFVAAMVAGGLMGWAGLALPQVETGIAASVLVLGLMVAFALRLPATAAMALVAGFALCHGYAHGVEVPLAGGLSGFVLGFALATASLHGIGLAAGSLTRRLSAGLLRAGGIGVAVAGAWLSWT